jgi:rubrerythrin
MQIQNNITSVVLVVTCLVLLEFQVLARADEAVTPKVGTTLENLLVAFNGESNANARYLAFAQKADEEGYGKAASLFRATARAEQVHIERHAAVIKKLGGKAEANIETPVVKSTKENLQSAIDGETYESTKMYPAFVSKAKNDKSTSAVDAFEDAGKAEAVHAGLYKQALADLDNWKIKTEFKVCPKCGNIVDVIPGPSCPICMEDTKKFIPVS